MNVVDLDRPLVGALALNYLGYGLEVIINGLWAWVAFVTAAINLWRMSKDYPSSSSSLTDFQKCSPEEEATVVLPVMVDSRNDDGGSILNDDSLTTPLSAAIDETEEGQTRGKVFTAYEYYEVEQEDEYGKGGRVAEWEWNNEAVVRSLRMKKECEWHWHRNLDLTAIDGSVVRLWSRSGCGQLVTL